MHDRFWFGIALIFGAALYLSLIFSITQKKEFKREAVERGYAEWIVDSNGNTTWKWKE